MQTGRHGGAAQAMLHALPVRIGAAENHVD